MIRRLAELRVLGDREEVLQLPVLRSGVRGAVQAPERTAGYTPRLLPHLCRICASVSMPRRVERADLQRISAGQPVGHVHKQ
jgi:hypothetical protein